MRFLISLLFYLISLWVLGSNSALSFDRVKIQNTLLSNSITSIAQDNTGFLWLGTEYGLVRFDGYNFLSFYADEENSNSLPSNIIKRIIKSSNGNIWIGTDRGIAYVEITSGAIIQPNYCSQFSNFQINTLCEDSEGNIWIGTNDGVKVFNPELKRSIPISITLDNQKSFNVNFIDIDKDGNIWIGSNYGYCVIKKISTNDLFTQKKINGKKIIEKTRLGYFKIDSQNRIWINDNGKNYIYQIGENQKITNKTLLNNEIDAKSILLLNDNRILIGSRWNGLTEFDNSNSNQVIFVSQYWMNSESTSDLSNTINALFEDKSGNIWAGTKAGLFVNRKSHSTLFHNIKADIKNTHNLSHNSISSIYQSSKNEVWIGTSSGLNGLKLKNGVIPIKPNFSFYNPNFTNSHNFDVAIQCLVMDNNQQLWVGTKQGILFFDLEKNIFYKNESISQFINQNNISLTKAFFRDSHNNIWMGFTYGGLVQYSAEDKKCYQIEQFANKDVWAIEKDHAGNMWIGTHNGLFRFNSNMYLSQISENTKEYKHKSENENSIASNWITSIKIAANGDVWIGTSEGLCRYNLADDNFEHFDLSIGNHPPYISGITEDIHGEIWVSTTSGVIRIDKKNNIDYFEISEGNFSSINYTFGHLLTEKGQVLLGGTSGLIYFNSDEIKPDTTKQSIYFSQLLLPNRELASKNININDLSKVTIKNNDKHFSIRFSTLNYASTSSVKYSYRINEISKDWIYLDNLNYVSFSNLPHGKYSLEVRSSTASGFWQKEPRKIQIIVLPPWWQTSFAYILYFIIFATLTYLIFIWLRRREIQNRNIELNNYKLVFYTNLLHSINGPLTLMQAPLNNLLQNYRKLTSNEIGDMLKFLHRNSKRLSHTMMQLLEFRKIDRGKLSLNVTKNDIIALLNDIYESFSELAESKQIHFNFETKLKSQILVFDFEKIEIVLFNLLSNAFKFTNKDGEVSMQAEVSQSGNEFKIIISDTGIGITKENQQQIFDRFWQVYNDNPSIMKGTGIGLSLAKDFVEAHHGKIEVQSEINQGSKFIISLLIGDELLSENTELKTDEIQIRKANKVAHYVEIENEISIQEMDEIDVSKNSPIIFILSDNKETLNFLFISLNKNFRVFLFEKEESLFEKMKDVTPALFISDIYLDFDFNGLEFCKKIKTDVKTSHKPFILLAHDSNEEEKLKAYDSGADAYFQKPLDISLLNIRIAKMLKLRDDIKEKSHRELLTNPQKIVTTSQNTKFLQEVMSIIEENMDDESFNLEDFAYSMKVSRSKLNSRMLSLTGQSPIEFLRNIRLKRAAQLLETDAFTISEVSYKVGISDPRYFSTIFKKQYGMSPLQYAKKKNEIIKDVKK